VVYSLVGWVHLVGGRGAADLPGGPIFILYGAPYIRYRNRGASTLAGGPSPRGPPDATGLVVYLYS